MAAKLLMAERVSDSKLYYIRLNFAKFAAKEEIIIIIIIIINLIRTNAAWTIKYMKKHTQ